MACHSWLLLQTHTVAILFHLPPSLFGDAYYKCNILVEEFATDLCITGAPFTKRVQGLL